MRKRPRYTGLFIALLLILIILIIIDVIIMSSISDGESAISEIKRILNIGGQEDEQEMTAVIAEITGETTEIQITIPQPETTVAPETTEPETEPQTTANITDVTLPETSSNGDSQSRSYVYDSQTPENGSVDDSYFDDALFIGDSRTMGFCNYMDMKNCYAQVSLGAKTAMVYKVVALYSGGVEEDLTVIDALKRNKDSFKKVYLCLGVNEHATKPDVFATYYEKLINAVIDAVNEGTVIYVESVLPVNERKASENGYNVKNSELIAFNDEIAALCPALGVHFVNVAEALLTEGKFEIGYNVANDGVHLNASTCQLVKNYLITHTYSVKPAETTAAVTTAETTAAVTTAEQTTAVATAEQTTAVTTEEQTTAAETAAETTAEDNTAGKETPKIETETEKDDGGNGI